MTFSSCQALGMATLNATEFDLMQSPLRRFSQRHIELRVFQRMLRRQRIDLRDKAIIDVGCGSGYGLASSATRSHRGARSASI